MSDPIEALSIRQPWAWAILHAGKDIENRSWPTRVRGRILIHVGKTIDKEGIEDLRDMGIEPPETFETGGVVGSVEIVGCVRQYDSRWFCGPYGFVLKDARSLPFRAVRGRLGFFLPEAPHE